MNSEDKSKVEKPGEPSFGLFGNVLLLVIFLILAWL